jgi:hypothetical protein
MFSFKNIEDASSVQHFICQIQDLEKIPKEYPTIDTVSDLEGLRDNLIEKLNSFSVQMLAKAQTLSKQNVGAGGDLDKFLDNV